MIGGLQPCSFIDFPGHLSAVVFLRGCNLRCPYCHNEQLLTREGTAAMSEAALRDFLFSRRRQLDGVVFSGGEPTLQPGLRALIEDVRSMGFKIKLDTNGTRPDVLRDLLQAGLLDYVAMDLKDVPEGYAQWLGLAEPPECLRQSLAIIKASGVPHELRTTMVLPYHDEARLSRMAHWATGCGRWLLQPVRLDAQPRDAAKQLQNEATIAALALRVRDKCEVPCQGRISTPPL